MKRYSILSIEALTLFLVIFLSGGLAQAGKVAKVKGKIAYVKLSSKEQRSVSVGSKMFLKSQGKKKAIVKVRKLIKGKKYAVVQVLKGKAKPGYLASAKSSSSSSSSSRSSVVRESKQRPAFSAGLIGGFALTNQTVSPEGIDPSEQTGTMLSGKLLLDYSLFGDIGIRAQAGTELFSVLGEGLNFGTNSTGEVGTNITYLSLDILVRGRFRIAGPLLFYGNVGVGILSPISSETTSLDPDSISTTSIVIGGGGLGFNFGKLDIFFGADYYYFPPSSDVNTNAISVKGGFMYAF